MGEGCRGWVRAAGVAESCWWKEREIDSVVLTMLSLNSVRYCSSVLLCRCGGTHLMAVVDCASRWLSTQQLPAGGEGRSALGYTGVTALRLNSR